MIYFLVILLMMIALFFSGYITALLVQHTKLNWLKPKTPNPVIELYDCDTKIDLTMRGVKIFTGIVRSINIERKLYLQTSAYLRIEERS